MTHGLSTYSSGAPTNLAGLPVHSNSRVVRPNGAATVAWNTTVDKVNSSPFRSSKRSDDGEPPAAQTVCSIMRLNGTADIEFQNAVGPLLGNPDWNEDSNTREGMRNAIKTWIGAADEVSNLKPSDMGAVTHQLYLTMEALSLGHDSSVRSDILACDVVLMT